MTDLFAEMTQGDTFYYEIAFTDRYGSPCDLTGWDVAVTFRTSFGGDPLAIQTLDNEGVGFVNGDRTEGVIFIAFDADVIGDLELPDYPRNGDLVPSRVIVGDVKLTPPQNVELIQGTGARTAIFLKITAGVT